MSDPRNVIVIGSGPAGYTAALYTARAALNPLVLEGSVTAGGALMNTTEVENFPGFRDGIMGPALMDEMRAQAERFGAELVADDVVEVDLTGDLKVVKTATETYTARSVILATGSGYRKLGLPREEELSGRGVSWCATCDGFFFRDQAIAVVGGGDSAIEEATFLTRFGQKVYLIHRRDELRASKIMQERAFADPKLEIVWNAEIAEINGDERLESVTLRDTVTGDTRPLEVTGLFIAIGHDPRSELLGGQVDLDDDGYVLVAPPVDRTPTCRASSPAATSSTTTTGRRSPPPAPAAPPRSTPSATSPRSTTHASTAGSAEETAAALTETVQARRGLTRAASGAGTSVGRWLFTGSRLSSTCTRTERGARRGEHCCCDRRRVRGRGPQVRQARAGRLLGRVVRTRAARSRRSSRRSRPSTARRSPSSR